MNNQKKIQAGGFDEFRQYHFNELAGDVGAIFQYFYVNNGIFQLIQEEDINRVDKAYEQYINRQSSLMFGTYASIIFVNRVVLRKMPKYPNFRLTLFIAKYVGIPFATYGLGDQYFVRQQKQLIQQMAEKYNFGYQEYNKAMDIFERAYRVGRLDELVEKGENFDWSGVPEFTSKYSNI